MNFFHFDDEGHEPSEVVGHTELQQTTGDLAQQIMEEMLYNAHDDIMSTSGSGVMHSTQEGLDNDRGDKSRRSIASSDNSIRQRTFDAQIHAMDLFYPKLNEKGRPFVIIGDKDNILRAYALNDNLTPIFELGEDIESRHTDRITCIKCYQPPGEDTIVVVSGSKDRTLRVWVVQSLSSFKTLRDGHEDTVWCLDIISQQDVEPLIVSGGIDGYLIVWSMLRGEKLREIYLGDQRAIFCLSAYTFQGAAMVLFGGEDEMITLWSISSGEVVRTYQGHSDAVYTVSVITNYCSEPHEHFSVQSQVDDIMATGGKDHQVIVWSITTGMQLRCFSMHRTEVFSLILVPILIGQRHHSKGNATPFGETRESQADRMRRIVTEEQAAQALYGDEVDSDDDPDDTAITVEASVSRKKATRTSTGVPKQNSGSLESQGIAPFSLADSKTEYVIDAVLVSSDKNGNIFTTSLTCGSVLRQGRYHTGAVRSLKCKPIRKARASSSSLVYARDDSILTESRLDASLHTINPLYSESEDNREGKTKLKHKRARVSLRTDVDPTLEIYSLGVDKTLIVRSQKSLAEEAWEAYEADKAGKLLSVKVLNQMPDKYRRWCNVYEVVNSRKIPLDSFFSGETFLLFHQSIIDGESTFIETFLPECPSGLELSTYYTIKDHGYDIFGLRESRKSARTKTGLAYVEQHVRNHLGKLKAFFLKSIGYQNQDKVWTFSLLRTALDHHDVRSIVVVLDVWSKLVNQPAKDWLYQYKGSYTRLTNEDLVLCSELYPALFVDFMLKVKLQVCHPYVTAGMNASIPPKREYIYQGSDANLKLDKAMWKKSNDPPVPTNCGLFVPLMHPNSFDMMKAYVQASKKTGSVRIFSSDAIHVGVEMAWKNYGLLNHVILFVFFVTTAMFFFALWYIDIKRSSLAWFIFSSNLLCSSIGLEVLKEVLTMIWSEDIRHLVEASTILTFLYFFAVTTSLHFMYEVLRCGTGIECVDNSQLIGYVTNACLSVMVIWVKGFRMLTPDKNIGPIIATVGNVIWDTRFLLLMIFLLVIAFSLAFWVLCAPELGGENLERFRRGFLFNEHYFNGTAKLPEWLDEADMPELPAQRHIPGGYFAFSTLQGSLLTTFSYVMGQFDITNFNTCGLKPTGEVNLPARNFAVILSMVFVALVAIVMINVLIALMTESYSRSVPLGFAQTSYAQARIMLSYHPAVVIAEAKQQSKRNKSLCPALALVLTSGLSSMATAVLNRGSRGGDAASGGREANSVDVLLDYSKRDSENLDGIISALDEESSEMIEEQLQNIETMTNTVSALVKQRRRF